MGMSSALRFLFVAELRFCETINLTPLFLSTWRVNFACRLILFNLPVRFED